MVTSTITRTQTYTVTDIRRVLTAFAADFGMIGQATGLRSRENVDGVVKDLTGFAEGKYLQAIHLILLDVSNNELRAARYAVSTSASDWTSERPGNNLWPRVIGGRLYVIADLSSTWWRLSDAEKTAERKRLGISSAWNPTAIDTTHSGLTAAVDRRYASNGFGVEKTVYQ